LGSLSVTSSTTTSPVSSGSSATWAVRLFAVSICGWDPPGRLARLMLSAVMLGARPSATCRSPLMVNARPVACWMPCSISDFSRSGLSVPLSASQAPPPSNAATEASRISFRPVPPRRRRGCGGGKGGASRSAKRSTRGVRGS